jgi:RecB family exonuclease
MPFVMPVGGSEIRGIIDLVFEGADGPWEVVDYKTSAPKAAGAEEHEFQLGLYALAASRWVGRPIGRWSVHFLGSGLTAERPVAPADLDGIESRTRAALAGIAAGHFEHSGRRREGCDHCQVKTVCEAYP